MCVHVQQMAAQFKWQVPKERSKRMHKQPRIRGSHWTSRDDHLRLARKTRGGYSPIVAQMKPIMMKKPEKSATRPTEP